MASLAALREARAALEQCLSALDGVESEIEGEAVKGGEAEEVTMQRKGKRRREEIGFDKEVGVSFFFAHHPFQKKKKKQLRSALRSAVADAAATVVSLEDETGEWEEGNEGTCPPPWAPGAPRLDFGALAARHPRLAPFLVVRQMRRRKRKKREKEEEEQEEEEEEEVKAIASPTLDFSSHDACAALTAALLLEGCGVRGWSVPRGSLVPPLGVRDEYLSYVSKLVFSSASSSFSSSSSSRRRHRRRPRILDVGCGSNLVFCLLASSSSPGGRRWRSVGLDASPAALADAQKILERNPQLSPLVELRKGPEDGLVDAERVGILRHGFKLKRKKAKENGGGGGLKEGGGEGDEKNDNNDDYDNSEMPPPPQNSNDLNSDLDPLDLDDDEWFDATVCNPPFFSSAAERAATASSFAAGAWGGTDAEVVFAGSSAAAGGGSAGGGGEAAFVSKMIRESRERDFEIGRRVGWFTVFLGKKATLRSMVALLRGENESAGRGIGGKEGDEGGGAGAAATATATATASNPPLLQPLKTSRRPALRWRALDEHGGRTTRWVLAWSWTQQQ